MNRNASGLEFSHVAQLQITEPALGIGEAVESAFIEVHHVDTSVDPQPLQPVDSPDFRVGVNIQKPPDLMRIPPGYDDHLRPPIVHDFLDHARYAGIWVGLIAVHPKWSERTVVIKHQHRLRRWR